MKVNNLKILAIIFLALLAVAIFPYISEDLSFPLIKKQENSQLFADKPSFEEISSVEIKTSTSVISMKRHSDGWRVNGYYADSEKIKSFVEEFNNITTTKLVSKNPGNFGNFGVDDQAGYFIKIVNNEQFDVVLGNYAPGISSFYIRKADSDQVFEAGGNLRTMANSDFTDWMSKKVFNLNKDAISKISISGVQNWTLTKNKGTDTWTLTKNRRNTQINAEQMDSALTALLDASAGKIYSGEEIELFTGEKSKLNLKIEDENQTVLSDVDLVLKEITYWIKPAGSENAFFYEIALSAFEQLTEITK